MPNLQMPQESYTALKSEPSLKHNNEISQYCHNLYLEFKLHKMVPKITRYQKIKRKLLTDNPVLLCLLVLFA